LTCGLCVWDVIDAIYNVYILHHKGIVIKVP
jgi:hypothetical protein